MSDVVFMAGDALSLPPESFTDFDLQVVDPPYSDYVHKHMASHGSEGRGSRGRDPGFGSLTNELREHIAKIANRVRRWSLIFSDHESTHLWRSAVQMRGNGDYIREKECVAEYEEDIRWIRWSQPQLSGDRPPQTSESVLHFHRAGAKQWNGPGSLTHFSNRCLRGDGKHPTEKPLDLLLNMVSWYSNPGESVVDVCAGAGTTALAAKLLGRDCLCVEADPKWKAVADARLALKWLARDKDRATEWCVVSHDEATDALARPRTKSKGQFTDELTRARALARLADVQRVAAWL